MQEAHGGCFYYGPARAHTRTPVISPSCIFHSLWMELSGGSDDVQQAGRINYPKIKLLRTGFGTSSRNVEMLLQEVKSSSVCGKHYEIRCGFSKPRAPLCGCQGAPHLSGGCSFYSNLPDFSVLSATGMKGRRLRLRRRGSARPQNHHVVEASMLFDFTS